VSAFRQQALIEAPVQSVWDLVGDPRRYPEWAGFVVEVTGLEAATEGAEYRQTMKTPLGNDTTTFVIEELDDMREIRLRCLKSGYYSHWVLTEAGDDTFCEVEVGMRPDALPHKAFDKTLGKRWYRNMVTEWLDQVRAALR
jgi:uncharacterized protein YndB with AHSA1/START domain